MTTPACPSYAGYRFPAEIISHAVWLYCKRWSAALTTYQFRPRVVDGPTCGVMKAQS